jgi:hypothetical protein
MGDVLRRRRGGERLLPAVLAGVGAAVLAAALFLAGVVPALAGARTVVIGTASADSLAPGALAVVRPASPGVGDVVALAPARDTSRLAVVEQVDAAGAAVVRSPDGLLVTVPPDEIDGVYLYGVPGAGALWSALSTPSGMFFAAALLLLLVAAQQRRTARRRAGHTLTAM